MLKQRFPQALQETRHCSPIPHPIVCPKRSLGKTGSTPQALLGIMQREFPPFWGRRSPFLLPPKTNLALTWSLDTAVNAPASSSVGDVSTLEKSQRQSCKGVMFLHWYHQARRQSCFFPSLTCSSFPHCSRQMCHHPSETVTCHLLMLLWKEPVKAVFTGAPRGVSASLFVPQAF